MLKPRLSSTHRGHLTWRYSQVFPLTSPLFPNKSNRSRQSTIQWKNHTSLSPLMLHISKKTWYRSIKESFSLGISTPSCCLPLYFLGFFFHESNVLNQYGHRMVSWQGGVCYSRHSIGCSHFTRDLLLGKKPPGKVVPMVDVLSLSLYILLLRMSALYLLKNIHVIIYKLLDLICTCMWKRSRYGMQKTYDMMQSKFQRDFGIWNKFIGVGNGDIGTRVNIQCPPYSTSKSL